MHPCSTVIKVQPRLHLAAAENWGPKMIGQLELLIKHERAIETRLWRGVIARTIQDWLSNPLRPKREAEKYLFENSADLTLVSDAAGINISRLRTCLNKVRGRTLLDLAPVAA